ncbi:MAG: MFS transporter [Gordonia sp. (in: high G+C Gram-positive bacteria)]|uniref:MFS transporter n=1 Tax=Gordonia sp. (in: high G+C Gram-positive bacteria) TaxID=84139 RepID=UPI0039E465FC
MAEPGAPGTGSSAGGALGTWRELFDHTHRAPMIVMAGGVGLFATNTYVTTSLLPSAVREIGGESLYAWTMTVFVVAAVISSMLVSRALARLGGRLAYLTGFGVFALGTFAAATAPNMPVMLVARGVQGAAAGLLAGLGFAVLRLVLPEQLWQRAVALMSAMWGVGNLLGPVIGGFFAQIGQWRGAFVLLGVVALGLAILTLRALPAQARADDPGDGIGWLALALLAATALLVSIASIVSSPFAIGGLVVLAVICGVGFIAQEREADARVLPASTYRGVSPLRWIYASIAVLALAGTIEMFIPLFGQRLGGLSPLVAGFLGAAISWGWTVGSLLSSNLTGERQTRIARVAGPLIVSVGLLGYGLLQWPDPGVALRVGWFATLFVAGLGIGMAMCHWLTAGMKVPAAPEEVAKQSAGMNTSQLIATAFGSALAGLLVALGGPGILGSARVLSYGYAVIGLLAVVIALREFTVARRFHLAP